MTSDDLAPAAWRYLIHGEWFVTNIRGAAEFRQSEGCVVDPLYTAIAQSNAEPVATVTFWYQNYRGEISRRVAAILGLRWGSSEYHKEPQWLLRGFDLEKEAEREFAVKDMAPTRDALAQSDAEPVGWYRPAKETLGIDIQWACPRPGAEWEPLYTAPPRPDASAGLIAELKAKLERAEAAYRDVARFNTKWQDKVGAAEKRIAELEANPDASAGPAGPPPNQGSGGKRSALEVKVTSNDASAGLIEAAANSVNARDIATKIASRPALAKLIDTGALKFDEMCDLRDDIEKALRSRAADRSGK